MAEIAVASVTENQHGNDVRQDLGCRVVVVPRGVAVNPDVAATIIAREPDVGVSHGHLTNKLVMVIAYRDVPLVLVDDTHEI